MKQRSIVFGCLCLLWWVWVSLPRVHAEQQLSIRLSLPVAGGTTRHTSQGMSSPDLVQQYNTILDKLRRSPLSSTTHQKPSLQQRRIEWAQRRLKGTGLYAGPLDGILDSQMRAALRHYQTTQGLPETGELDELTRRALGIP